MMSEQYKKRFRVSPVWWPILLVFSPLLIPFLIKKFIEYRKGRKQVDETNKERIENTSRIDLPELEYLKLSVVVDRYVQEGYISDTGVSYLIETDRGSTMFDVGFGPMTEAFENNTKKLGLTTKDFDELVISHLHTDHMGGNKAQRDRNITVPQNFVNDENKICYVPDECSSNQFETIKIDEPKILQSGLVSTGPLARMLFLFGHTEEQALVGKVKGKGLFIITGCGHPTIEKIVEMVKKMSNEEIFAIAGGLHFPISKSPSEMAGIQFQQLIGTGKPIWKKMTKKDLTKTIKFMEKLNLQELLLSGHDTCDYSLERMKKEVKAERTKILTAGVTYTY